MHTIPLSSTALAQDKALSRDKSIGFSQKTGLPIRAHCSMRSGHKELSELKNKK